MFEHEAVYLRPIGGLWYRLLYADVSYQSVVKRLKAIFVVAGGDTSWQGARANAVTYVDQASRNAQSCRARQGQACLLRIKRQFGLVQSKSRHELSCVLAKSR